jgi:hypothetical protein
MVELAKLIHMQTVELEEAVKGIRSMKDPNILRNAVLR